MEEYYSKKALIDAEQDTWWDVRDIEVFLDEVPRADVVPREEVDRIKRYIRLNEDIAMKCKEENGEQNREYFKGKFSRLLADTRIH